MGAGGDRRFVTVRLGEIDFGDRTFMHRLDLEPDWGLLEDLVLHGQTTPVFLRPNGGVGYQIVSGFRRVTALRLLCADEQRVLARIYEEVDEDGALLLSISENVHRQAYTDLEQALLMARLRAGGMRVAEIADRFGIADRSVYNYL